MSLSTIVRSEGQTTQPRKATVKALAGAYAKPVEWFYGEGDPNEEQGRIEEELEAQPTVEGRNLSNDERHLVEMYRDTPPHLRPILLGVVEAAAVKAQEISNIGGLQDRQIRREGGNAEC